MKHARITKGLAISFCTGLMSLGAIPSNIAADSNHVRYQDKMTELTALKETLTKEVKNLEAVLETNEKDEDSILSVVSSRSLALQTTIERDEYRFQTMIREIQTRLKEIHSDLSEDDFAENYKDLVITYLNQIENEGLNIKLGTLNNAIEINKLHLQSLSQEMQPLLNRRETLIMQREPIANRLAETRRDLQLTSIRLRRLELIVAGKIKPHAIDGESSPTLALQSQVQPPK